VPSTKIQGPHGVAHVADEGQDFASKDPGTGSLTGSSSANSDDKGDFYAMYKHMSRNRNSMTAAQNKQSHKSRKKGKKSASDDASLQSGEGSQEGRRRSRRRTKEGEDDAIGTRELIPDEDDSWTMSSEEILSEIFQASGADAPLWQGAVGVVLTALCGACDRGRTLMQRRRARSSSTMCWRCSTCRRAVTCCGTPPTPASTSPTRYEPERASTK
jgi:hypothetical protein